MNSLCCRVFGVWMVTVSWVACAQLTAQELPNIVLVLADDLGYGDVHALNPDSTLPTPNLDALAESGLTFLDAHSPSAVCTPTRYGLLTGRYCWRSRLKRGVLGGYSEPLIEAGRLTIADVLGQRGYNTGAVGKWHLGMQLPRLSADADTSEWAGDPGIDFAGKITDGPLQHGFDEYFGVTASLDMPPYVFVENDGFDSLPTLQQPAVSFPHFVRQGPRSENFVIGEVLDNLTEHAVDFIERQAEKAEPYFLYMPLTGPHKPTQPHERFRGTTKLSEYGDFVHQVDWTVGRVLKAIDETGESENTLVIFSSDNGSYMFRYDEESGPSDALAREDHVDDSSIQGFRATRHRSNGPLRGTKADVWEAGHRVPCFVRWPGQIEAGRKLNTVVCLTDIYATLAELTGSVVKDGQAEDSVSLVSVIENTWNSDKAERTARGVPVVNHSVSGMFAIRDGRWKLVCGDGSGGREKPKGKPFDEPFQLYDLVDDIGESRDLASQQPDRVKAMVKALEGIRGSSDQ